MVDYDKLNLNIRETVRWLNENGFETIDSGDGSNYEGGMEGAMPCPMVVVKADDPYKVQGLSLLIKKLLEEKKGIDFNQKDLSSPYIEASYSPIDGKAVIVITNVML